jgi:hypothetical protein
MINKKSARAEMKAPQALSNTKQSGFIQAVILFGIALIAAVIGAFALSGKGATKSTSSEEAKLAASTLIKQAGDLQEAVQRYRSDRGGFAGMTFSTDPITDASTGLFNTTDRFATRLVGPTRGYVTKRSPNIEAVAGGNRFGSWILKKTLTLDTVAANWAVVTTGLTRDTCIRINNMIYGAQYPVTLAPMASGATDAIWQTIDGIVTVDFTGTATVTGIPEGSTEGCVQTSTTAANPDTGVAAEPTFAYFKVVNERGAN